MNFYIHALSFPGLGEEMSWGYSLLVASVVAEHDSKVCRLQ